MMCRRARGEEGGEKGAALVIALVFLSLFGVLIAEQLQESAVNFKTTAVVRSRSAKLFALDGALNTAVQQARANDTYCPNSIAGPSVFPIPSLNALTPTTACGLLTGAVADPAAQQWAVITTSPLPASLITVGTAADSISGGDVFTNGGLSLSGNLPVTEGDVLQRAAACGGVAQPLLMSLGAPDLWSCTTAAVPDVPHKLPPLPPLRTNPVSNFSCGGVSWSILHPGTYVGTTGSYTFDRASFNYLESGVYYLQDVGVVNFGNEIIVGGQPKAPETSGLACPTDTSLGAASQASGKGVVIILGGNSSISLANLLPPPAITYTELFSRAPAPGDTSTPGMSIMAVPDNSVAGYIKSTALSAFADISGVGNITGGSELVAIHGLVYSPTAPVTIEASGVGAPLLAGVVAWTLTVLQPIGANGILSAVAASGRRTLLFTSAVTAPGEIPTVEHAVVKIANDPARTATVRSWRAV